MNTFNRRKFLKTAGLGAITAFSLSPKIGLSMSGAPSDGVVVLVFLRGGCDGLHMLMPTSGSDTDILQTHRPDLLSAQNNQPYIPVDNSFAMHPKMAPLQQALDDNCLTFFPATHCGIDLAADSVSGNSKYPNYANMSHFTNQKILEFGGGINPLNSIQGRLSHNGWLARAAQLAANSQPLDAINKFGFSRVDVLDGDTSTMFLSDITKGTVQPGRSELNDLALVEAALQANVQSANLNKQLAATTARDLELLVASKISKLNDVIVPNIKDAAPAPFAYLKTAFGQQLAQTASMIIDDDLIPELEFVSCDLGGFDHHVRLKANMDTKMEDLATNLAAFHAQIGAQNLNKKVEVVVLTEFGRTVDQNGRGEAGTDHGQAFTAMVLSNQATGNNAIRYGNRNYNASGAWPGLDQLVHARGDRFYLDAVTDYRDILCETIGGTLSHDPTAYDSAQLAEIYRQSDSTYVRQIIPS